MPQRSSFRERSSSRRRGRSSSSYSLVLFPECLLDLEDVIERSAVRRKTPEVNLMNSVDYVKTDDLDILPVRVDPSRAYVDRLLHFTVLLFSRGDGCNES